MRLLYVTGKAAESSVRKYAGDDDVEVMPLEIAAFLNPELLEIELSGRNLSGFDFVVVPGGSRGDYSKLSRMLSIPVVKGPTHAADIPIFLKQLGKVIFSPNTAADDIIRDEISRGVDVLLAEGRNKKTRFVVGKTRPVYLGAFPHVLAEIPDAPRLSDNEVSEKAKYFVESGASIIDLGFIEGQDNTSEVGRLLSAVRSAVDVPVSVDSFNEKEVLAGVDAGCDLVLSLSADNIQLASSFDVPFVVVAKRGGIVSDKADERVRLLCSIIDSDDFTGRVIADPILNPLGLGFTESVKACMLFGEKRPDVPLFFGAGNVTELVDADSQGVNTVLAATALEVGAGILFTTEASPKTRGCVRELARASEMSYLARKREQPPKDLGIDLLVLKEKRFLDESGEKEDGLSFERVGNERDGVLEDSSFRVYLEDGLIRVVYRHGGGKIAWEGDSAESISKRILAEAGVSRTHAAYLGRELAKAEIALRLGKNYVQDEDLF